jgi:hypothetical protein
MTEREDLFGVLFDAGLRRELGVAAADTVHRIARHANELVDVFQALEKNKPAQLSTN